jgi:hypothetical protein
MNIGVPILKRELSVSSVTIGTGAKSSVRMMPGPLPVGVAVGGGNGSI